MATVIRGDDNFDTSKSGQVLQVVSTTKTSTFSTSAGSWTDVTGLSATITPVSNQSKILVIASVSMDAPNLVAGRLVRDSTPIAVGTSGGSQFEGTFSKVSSYYAADVQSVSHLDSPNTTSSTTYKIQVNGYASIALYVNRARDMGTANRSNSVSSITLMEIGE
tara:strand:- start:138 stop:629 length:492 start_codon:yes stop_codon:yes gene_type:complete